MNRILALVLLTAALGGLLVLAGTITPDPAHNRFPGTDELADDYATHVGDEVETGGTVVSTDPLVIETTPDVGESLRLTIIGVDEPVSEGGHLAVFGTLGADNTVEAHGAIYREPWELRYMYAVSFIAGLWVLGRFLSGWRFRPARLAFEPRDLPPRSRGGTDTEDADA